MTLPNQAKRYRENSKRLLKEAAANNESMSTLIALNRQRCRAEALERAVSLWDSHLGAAGIATLEHATAYLRTQGALSS